jgi:hypothetical protein
MSNIYHPMVLQERIAKLENDNSKDQLGDIKNEGDSNSISFLDLLSNDKYKKSTAISCVLAILQ